MIVTLITAVAGAVIGAITTIAAARMTAVKEIEMARLPPYDMLSLRVAKLEEQVGVLRAKLETMQDRETMWAAGWRDLHTRWDYHREQTIPPPFPVDCDAC